MKKYLLLLISIILLGGCTKETIEPVEEEPVVVIEPEIVAKEKQTEILRDYYEMLKSNTSKDEIKKYLDTNVSRLDANIVDEIIISLEEYLTLSNPSIKDISEILINYRNYSTDEIKSYLDILNTEGQMMFSDGESISVDLSELLNRSISAENHLRSFPDGKTNSRIQDYFIAYISGAIEGVGNQYIYAEEGSSKIRAEVLDTYNDIIEANSELSTSQILQKYLEDLKLDEYDLNGVNVLKFYEDLPVIIKDKTRF